MNYKFGLRELNDPRREQFTKMVVDAELAANLPTEIDYYYIYPPVDDQGPFGTCHKKGTLIKMADGSVKPIEDVKTLDKVVTAEGNVHIVEGTMVREHKENILELDIWGNNLLSCTKEHPILTERGYVKAADLNLDDWIAMPSYSKPADAFLDVMTFLTEKDYKQCRTGTRTYAGFNGNTLTYVTHPPKLIEYSEELGFLFGTFLAEGSTDVARIRWSFGAHEEHTLVAKTVASLKTLFGVEGRIQKRPNNCIQVNVYGGIWAKLFNQLFGKGAANKSIHPTLFNGSHAFLRGIFEGWMAGDGHVRNNRMQGVTISHKLALNMFDIANMLGYLPTIRKSKPYMNNWAKTRQPRYDVTFSLDFHDTNVSKARVKTVNGIMYHKVHEIKEVEFNDYVYNLQVAEDNSYIAEGIGVHNCVAFGNKKVFEAFHKKRTGQEVIISGRALWSELRAKFYPGDTQDDGAQVSDALAILEENYVLDSDWPYSYTSFTENLEPVPSNLLKTDFEYKNFVRVNPTVADLKYALVHHGMCVVGGSYANEWVSCNAEGQLQSNNLTMAGGHCYSILGYNDKFVNLDLTLGAFLCVNNWTTSYGKNGFMYMPYNVDPDFFPTDIFTVQV